MGVVVGGVGLSVATDSDIQRWTRANTTQDNYYYDTAHRQECTAWAPASETVKQI
jgi:hypothetical protein